MEEQVNKFSVSVDGTNYSWYAMQHALRYTRRNDILRIVHAKHMSFSQDERTGEKVYHVNEEEPKIIMERYKQICEVNERKCEFSIVPFYGSSTELANSLCRDAIEHQVEGIFMGTRGKTGINKYVLGSVSEYLVQHCPLTTTVVRPPSQ